MVEHFCRKGHLANENRCKYIVEPESNTSQINAGDDSYLEGKEMGRCMQCKVYCLHYKKHL